MLCVCVLSQQLLMLQYELNIYFTYLYRWVSIGCKRTWVCHFLILIIIQLFTDPIIFQSSGSGNEYNPLLLMFTVCSVTMVILLLTTILPPYILSLLKIHCPLSNPFPGQCYSTVIISRLDGWHVSILVCPSRIHHPKFPYTTKLGC